jgi:hypothetical protein
MAIHPTQLPIKVLFEQNHTFAVPKYQRSYAWNDEAIDDFVDDIKRCLEARKGNSKRNHFFGGVVTVRVPVPNSNRTNQEVIDGQQRLASFVMLVAATVKVMRGIVLELKKNTAPTAAEKKAKTFLSETIDSLKALYLTYRDTIQLEYVDVPKMTLSKSDDEFFQDIVSDKTPTVSRASHERILAAWQRFSSFLEEYLTGSGGVAEKTQRLQLLVNSVLAEDCTVIFMPSDTRPEAYQIFQVLNDRGVHLSDGDLLRARTLERLDDKKLEKVQDKVADRWDKVLGYDPQEIDSYLKWYFSSLEGKRPKSSTLVDQFLDARFKCKEDKIVTKLEADHVLKEVDRLEEEFSDLNTLCKGQWPYNEHPKVKVWDCERLRMLVVHLDHTNAMPLLLSLHHLDAKKFADAVSAIERFVFRYKTIGNAHISPMTELYLKHAKKIRETSNYSIKELRTDLALLVTKVVPDSVFEANLRELKYSTRAGNTNLRYMLITLEDHMKWYEQGAAGVPKCKDKTRVFDFLNTTLEHIYPQSADQKAIDVNLEKLKHSIGNLTIFGPDDNKKLGNKMFADKRLALKGSNLQLNRDIGGNNQWTAKEVQKRTDELVKMALKVFVP